MPGDLVPVCQADRDAFAALEEAFPPHMGGEVFRDGMADNHPGVQAFARHRSNYVSDMAEAADRIATLEARVEMLQGALRLFESAAFPVCTSLDKRGYRWCEAYLDQARAALAPEPSEVER